MNEHLSSIDLADSIDSEIKSESLHGGIDVSSFSGEKLKRRKYSEVEDIIREKLKHENVTSKSIELNLVCPISKQKMKIPVRFNSCTHLECLDFHSLLNIERW